MQTGHFDKTGTYIFDKEVSLSESNHVMSTAIAGLTLISLAMALCLSPCLPGDKYSP